jgi:undecaprenyl-diphosphatase
MEPLYALFLGIVQGLTEFLPVSSSGHLVILQHLFGMRSPKLLFDVAVHLGTLAAVVVFFRSDVAAIGRAVLGWRPFRRVGGNPAGSPDLRLLGLILAATVPTALIGLFIRFAAEEVFASPLSAGLLLMATGVLLIASRRSGPGRKDMADISLAEALGIGLVQGIAVFPGVSRSGATIATALFLGIRPDAAARFSFLLSIPSILGAALLMLGDAVAASAADARAALIGAVVAAAVGYAALWMLVFIVKRGRLYAFAPYCWAVGALGVCLAWIGA